jgi:hypothetical protein
MLKSISLSLLPKLLERIFLLLEMRIFSKTLLATLIQNKARLALGYKLLNGLQVRLKNVDGNFVHSTTEHIPLNLVVLEKYSSTERLI